MSDIVVGVDGSEGSVAALRWAVRDAALRGVGVRAILAWAPGGRPQEVDEGARSAHLDDLAYAASRRLHRVVGGLAGGVGGGVLGGAVGAVGAVGAEDVADMDLPIKIIERTVYSTPAHALLDESLDAQMVVVGSRPRLPVHRVVIGSVGDICAHDACVPVVVVRGHVNGEHGTRPIVVGVDGSVPSVTALRWAATEASLRRVPLHVVHASVAIPTARAGSAHGMGMVAADRQRAARDVMERCVAECQADTDGLDVQLTFATGGTAAALVDAAADAQMLVVGARGRGGFAGLLLGSTSHQCVTHARCSVAVVHAPRRDDDWDDGG